MSNPVDFAQAYYNGLEFVRNKKKEAAEIDAVLTRFCEEVHTASKGELACVVGWPYGHDLSEIKTVLLKRGKNRGVRSIFEIEPSQGGYPCVVKCGDWHKSVMDKNDLEATLAEALQSYSAAHKIHYLLTRSHEDTHA